MKKILLLIAILSINFTFSKTKKNTIIGSIKGKILDSKSKKTIPNATIVCKNKLHKIINGCLTNKKGEFFIKNLPLDSIFVEIQFIGYKTYTKAIVLSKNHQNVFFKNIYLEQNFNELSEVVVTSETSSLVQKIDRKVFYVGKDLNSVGNNSLELLENIPSIHVDFQNGTINLKGNNNVRVLIDGKPSNLSSSQVLKQIPSSSVKSIEIITNPSAKYNPEGMSGIINIILKKNTTVGFNGNLNVGAEHSINTRPSGSFNFNYRINKFNFYGNYGLDFGKFETFSFLKRLDKNLNQDINFLDNSNSHYTKVGVDYYINDKNTLSFYSSQSATNTDFFTNTKTIIDNNIIFDSKNKALFKTKEGSYNLDYKIDLKNEGEYLELEINYSNVTNPEEDFITEKIDPTNKEYNYINAIINNNSTFLTNLDYSKPINNGTIELGLESRVQRNFNKITTNQEIESSGNQSTNSVGNSELTYNRKTYSAYINLNKEFSKINIQTGIRLEQFNLDGVFSNTQQANIEPIKNQIFNIYPSVHITYLPSDKNQFQIGFSRRVDRPSITQVTPIQEWNSPLSISMGNRNLVPQYTNSIELNYSKTISKGYISLGTFYRKTKNIIGRIFNTDASNTDRQILSYTNYDSAESYGFEFSSRFKPLKWWTLRPSANLYIQDNQGFINNILSETNNTFFKARISNNLKASDRLRFSFSTSYRGKNQSVLAKIEDYFLVNIAAKYYILNKNGAISLRGTDIFDGYKLDFTTTNPFSQTGQFTLEYSAIYLGFSYNFGNGKNRERDRKYREENETQSSGGVL